MSPDSSRVESGSNQTSARQRVLFGTGLVLLIVCVGASGTLVWQHLTGLALPGCGVGSPCARATSSAWGTVPGSDWPIAFVGAAFFVAVAAVWIMCRGRPSAGLQNLVRLGAVASLGYTAVMLAGDYLCPYCVTVHVANVGFWLVGEFAVMPAERAQRQLVTAAIAFVLSTAGLAAAETLQGRWVQEREQTELAQSTEQIIQQRQTESPSGDPYTAGDVFTGRYRVGPENARIRLVIFSDYQCKDCARIEADIFAIFEERDDMSISIKQFPFSTDCNPYVPENLHPNACWAARAAETAGILRGNEGFWEMHHWLFDHGGSFTRPELLTRITEQGYDRGEWVKTMSGQESLDPVTADIEEAAMFGLRQTPLIYINGVELKGWRIANGVRQAVEALAATNVPPLTAAADRPKTQADLGFDTWLALQPQALPSDARSWAYEPVGSSDPLVDVTVWGDYQEPFTAEADGIIRAFMNGRTDVRYHFRHYPINQNCNPVGRATKHPYACLAAQAVEVAGMVGGVDGYWTMHVWLMENLAGFDEAALEQAVAALGFDADAFDAALQSAQASEAIHEDARAGRQAGLTRVPWIYVNGRFIERWRFVKREILSSILESAAEGQ